MMLYIFITLISFWFGALLGSILKARMIYSNIKENYRVEEGVTIKIKTDYPAKLYDYELEEKFYNIIEQC